MKDINNTIILRALEPEDVDRLYVWENDSQLWPYGSTRAPLSRHQLWEYVNGYDADIYKNGQLRLMIVEAVSGETIGSLDLYELDIRDLRAKIGIFILPQYRGHGYGSASLEAIEIYARETLALHQLSAMVGADNDCSVRLFKKCGYKSAGCLRSWIKRGKHYEDVLIFQKLFE